MYAFRGILIAAHSHTFLYMTYHTKLTFILFMGMCALDHSWMLIRIYSMHGKIELSQTVCLRVWSERRSYSINVCSQLVCIYARFEPAPMHTPNARQASCVCSTACSAEKTLVCILMYIYRASKRKIVQLTLVVLKGCRRSWTDPNERLNYKQIGTWRHLSAHRSRAYTLIKQLFIRIK